MSANMDSCSRGPRAGVLGTRSPEGTAGVRKPTRCTSTRGWSRCTPNRHLLQGHEHHELAREWCVWAAGGRERRAGPVLGQITLTSRESRRPCICGCLGSRPSMPCPRCQGCDQVHQLHVTRGPTLIKAELLKNSINNNNIKKRKEMKIHLRENRVWLWNV